MSIISKCFRSYLTGKKYLDNDISKAYDYFIQCNKLINDIKEHNITQDENIINTINETEIECNKYIDLTLESSLTLPTIIVNNEINLFEIIEKGEIKIFNNLKKEQINFQIFNEDGLSPLHMAIEYGDIAFLKIAFKFGSKIDMTNTAGYTLLEYACLNQDPNIISFLMKYGANMKKHIEFRNNKKYLNRENEIDIALLQKIILDQDIINYKIIYLDWIFNYINKNLILNIKLENNDDIFFEELILKLDFLISKLSHDSRESYLNILKEELQYDLINKSYCPSNKIEIILYYLTPFIDYNFNLYLFWLNKLEIKYLILKKNINNLKKDLKEKYIDSSIFTYEILNCLIKN